VKVLSTTCNSASITSSVSKWQSFSFIFNQGNRVSWVREDSHVVFGKKKKSETVHCCDATASSFVDKVQAIVLAHFHAEATKCHSSMQNWLFGLPG
jgi:hypothetical protein